MDITAWITDYGYVAVALAAFLEGEVALLAASLAVHMGLLSFPMVLLAAGSGALLIDHTFFLLGRQGGARFLAKCPKWSSRSRTLHRLIDRHHIPLMLGFRFLYGLRTLTLLVLGTSTIGILRFSLLDIVAVLLWTTIMGGACYFLGSLIMPLLPQIQIGLLLLILFASVLFGIFKRRALPRREG